MDYEQNFERCEPGYKLVENADEAVTKLLYDMHREFHCNYSPWLIKQAYYAFMELESDKLEDLNIEPDPYNHELLEWLHEPFAIDMVDQCSKDLGGDPTNIMRTISDGQCYCKMLIYERVNDFLQQRKEEDGQES